MANQVIGLIKAISKQETIQSSRGTQYTKQSIFLDNGRYDQETGERYDNDLLLEFINSRDGDLAQKFRVGDKVQVSFRLRGYSYQRDGNTQRGVSVSCYRIDPFVQHGQQNAPQQPAQNAQLTPNVDASGSPANQHHSDGGQADDGLPF